jgi:hypothetical protein
MKIVKLLALSIVAMYLLCAPMSHAQAKKGQKTGGGGVEQQVKALTEQVVQAAAKGDTSFLERYYADDILIIHGDGKTTTKAREMGGLQVRR